MGDSDFIVHFFEKKRFENSLEGSAANLSEGNEIMFSLSAGSKAEVDQWIENVSDAGGKIFFDPRTDKKNIYDDNGFYVFVFADPDGHKYNVLYGENT